MAAHSSNKPLDPDLKSILFDKKRLRPESETGVSYMMKDVTLSEIKAFSYEPLSLFNSWSTHRHQKVPPFDNQLIAFFTLFK